jgi:hypothetical protein
LTGEQGNGEQSENGVEQLLVFPLLLSKPALLNRFTSTTW